jgi:hypothetical protein
MHLPACGLRETRCHGPVASGLDESPPSTYVGDMTEPGQEPRPKSGPGALLSNWMTYDASFAAKLRMAASNTLIKLRNHQGCCGNHGQPGC